MLVVNKNTIRETPTFGISNRGEKLMTSIASVRGMIKDDLYCLMALYNQMKQNIDCGILDDPDCVTMPNSIDQQQIFNLCQLMDELKFINNNGQEE